ncbi:hypothetical protein FOZ63_018902, partial [Perkinsus olseni]
TGDDKSISKIGRCSRRGKGSSNTPRDGNEDDKAGKSSSSTEVNGLDPQEDLPSTDAGGGNGDKAGTSTSSIKVSGYGSQEDLPSTVVGGKGDERSTGEGDEGLTKTPSIDPANPNIDSSDEPTLNLLTTGKAQPSNSPSQVRHPQLPIGAHLFGNSLQLPQGANNFNWRVVQGDEGQLTLVPYSISSSSATPDLQVQATVPPPVVDLTRHNSGHH